MPSYVSFPLCLFSTRMISALSLVWISGCIAISYSKKHIVLPDVSNPAARNWKACPTKSSPSKWNVVSFFGFFTEGLVSWWFSFSLFLKSIMQSKKSFRTIPFFFLYSTVLQTVFLRYLFVSSSKNFIRKRFVISGAVNAVSPANPFRTEKSNIFRAYIQNSELGSSSAWPLIPKAQDAMTSVVYLYIISATSTGEP